MGRVKNIHNFDGPGVNDAFADTYQEGYAELGDIKAGFRNILTAF